MNKEPSHAELMALWNTCVAFIEKHKIGCAESIYQLDSIIIASSELVENVCNVIGYLPYEDEE